MRLLLSRPGVQLFLTSGLALYAELLCIRWVPAYVRFVAYFTNFILLASFLGLGVGILSSRSKAWPRLGLRAFPWFLLAIVLVVALTRFELRIESAGVLHHLADPVPFWHWLRDRFADTPLFLMDLMRPPTTTAARQMVDRYAAGEPEVLRTDFFNSLCAAYTPAEISAQLSHARLADLSVHVASDRHLIVCGRIGAARTSAPGR